MTMNGELRPNTDADKIYLSRHCGICDQGIEARRTDIIRERK